MVLLTGLQDETGFGPTIWRLAVLGVADALMLSAVAVAAIDAVPHRLAGMAAAANTALRQYGGALGPAVLGVILDEPRRRRRLESVGAAHRLAGQRRPAGARRRRLPPHRAPRAT